MDNKKERERFGKTAEYEKNVETETPELLQEQPVPSPKKATVNCDYTVALKKTPKRGLDSSDVITVLKNGESVTVIRTVGEFSEVSVKGYTGFIVSQFLN